MAQIICQNKKHTANKQLLLVLTFIEISNGNLVSRRRTPNPNHHYKMDPMEATSDGNLPESMEHSNEQVSSCGAKMSSNAVAGQPVKKIRKRKKQIFNLIRQQMEFYFSDANLSKDRFLKKLIVENPGALVNGYFDNLIYNIVLCFFSIKEVPLEVFMTFNKIKSQVTSVEEIEKAVSTSEKLGLSVDRKRVSRITEFSGGAEPDQSADERTIYVVWMI